MQSPPPDRALHVKILQSCGAAECKRLHNRLQKHCNINALWLGKWLRAAANHRFSLNAAPNAARSIAMQHKR
jgi:hypothetical protein